MIRSLIEMLLKESELTFILPPPLFFFFFLEILSALNFIVPQNHAELSAVSCRDQPTLVSLCIYESFELSEVSKVFYLLQHDFLFQSRQKSSLFR